MKRLTMQMRSLVLSFVPSLWQVEVANVLLMAERRKRIQEADILHFIRLLGQLPIEIDDTSQSMNDLVFLGKQHQLTSYDSCYLRLALTHGLPLATLDEKLKYAAKEAGALLFNM